MKVKFIKLALHFVFFFTFTCIHLIYKEKNSFYMKKKNHEDEIYKYNFITEQEHDGERNQKTGNDT